MRITPPHADNARMKMHADTRDLMILAGHAAGKNIREISGIAGCATITVASRLHALIRADIAHDPLAIAYWTKT